MKRIIIVALFVALAGCSKDPIATATTDNAQISVEELFTYEGIRVYRFRDGGRVVYFTKPSSDIRSVYTEQCGKNCSRTETTQTIRGEYEHPTNVRK